MADEAKTDGENVEVVDLTRTFPEQSPAQLLMNIATTAVADADLDKDFYGVGSSLNEFETSTAKLLGKEFGMLCVSGVMAQLIALQIHCRSRARSQIAVHRTSHLLVHEHDAYRELLGYEAITIGDPCKPLAASDLEALNPEKVGAVVVELPQRENGGATTSWEDLVAMRKWADTHDVALHLDGARLWEVQPSYGKPFSDITALFDTVYASFYKGLGAMVGAIVCGSAPLRRDTFMTWHRRFGGNIFTLLPIMVSARAQLSSVLSTFPARFKKMKTVVAAITSALHDAGDVVATVTFVPPVPQACLVHTYFGDASVEHVLAAAERVKKEHGIVVVSRCRQARFTPPSVSGGQDIPPAGILQPFAYTEWNMGVANMGIGDDVFVKGWVAFAQALLELKAVAPDAAGDADSAARS